MNTLENETADFIKKTGYQPIGWILFINSNRSGLGKPFSDLETAIKHCKERWELDKVKFSFVKSYISVQIQIAKEVAVIVRMADKPALIEALKKDSLRNEQALKLVQDYCKSTDRLEMLKVLQMNSFERDVYLAGR